MQGGRKCCLCLCQWPEYTDATINKSAAVQERSLKYRRFNAIVSQLKMHYFSGAFESLIASQLLKKEKYI